MRAYAGRGEDLANASRAWAGVSRRAGQGRVMPSNLPSGLRDPRHRDCGHSHPSRHGRKQAAARAPWPPVRPWSCARSGSRASPWSDTTAAAVTRTGWRATILLRWSGLRCSPWRCPRPWLRAVTTSLIEAQPLGADVRRAHLRGRRLRGADRRQASLGKAGSERRGPTGSRRARGRPERGGRTSVKTGRAQGVKFGRKPKLTPHQKREALQRRDMDGEPHRSITRSYNVSQSTISRLTR